MKLNWDIEIPSDLMKELNKLLKILNDLDAVEVNRNIFVNYENDPSSNVSFIVSTVQVHKFTGPQFMLKLFCNHGKFIPMS